MAYSILRIRARPRFKTSHSDRRVSGQSPKAIHMHCLNKIAKLRFMSPSERLLRSIQLNAISTLRIHLGTEQFIEWLITPSSDGLMPIEALEAGRWQEIAELADSISE